MENRYHIFELRSGGSPQWIDSAMELPESRQGMADLPVPAMGGQYLIRDFYSGAVVDYTLSLRPATH